MTDFLQLAEQLASALIPRRTVRYQRGEVYVDLDATVAASEVYFTDRNGMRVRAENRYYLIKVADLILSGSATEPAEGDEIIDTGDGATRTYRTMPGDSGEAWEYQRYHTQYRINVMEVDEF